MLIYIPSDPHLHTSPLGHPEHSGRLKAFHEGLSQAWKTGLIRTQTAPKAKIEDVTILHTPNYVHTLAQTVPPGSIVELDGGDTFLSETSLQAALEGVGAALEGVDLLLTEKEKSIFVATRPAGHHALKETAMGFCYFGTAALAAVKATSLGKKAAVLDFDFHHGNGTQALLWDKPNTFFASTHQLKAWPGTGPATDNGDYNNIHNYPLKSGAGSRIMQKAWTEIFEKLDVFEPDIIIVSAGFDAHQHDKMGTFSWQVSDYAWLGEKIKAASQTHNAGTLSILEGGYELSILRKAGKAYVEALL
jgi:acetoin utilization deacetylase AcuC-like enzyme